MTFIIGEVTLPVDPTKYTCSVRRDLSAMEIALEGVLPVLDLGPGVRVLKAEGYIADPPKVFSELYSDYISKLETMAKRKIAIPIVIVDDDQYADTFWTTFVSGSGSVGTPTLSDETSIVAKGDNSLKIVVPSGASEYSGIYHVYSPKKNFSPQNFISHWLYGLNNTGIIRLVLSTSSGNYFLKDLTDNWTGWARKLLRKDEFSSVGSPDWSLIEQVQVNFNTIGTRYLDRTVIGVGYYIDGPGTRYDGIWNVRKFAYPEDAKKGYMLVKYLLELYRVDDYY